MKRLFLALFLCVVGTSCAYSDLQCQGVFEVGSEFSYRESQAIYRGMYRVNNFTGQNTIVAGNYCYSVNKGNIPTAGYYYPSSGNITVNTAKVDSLIDDALKDTAIPDILLEKIVAHEFLHSVGLGHVSNGIMAQTINAQTEFTQEDYTECKRVGVCK